MKKANIAGLLILPLIILTAYMLGFGLLCSGGDKPEGGYEQARRNMVDLQIERRGITSKKVLNAFLKVERHLFVPDYLLGQAYNDHPLPIGEGQTISQPYVVAFMTDMLELEKNDKVLEIGTGSGYQAAILGEICDSVFTIEIFESLGTNAARLLKKLGYDNVHVKIADGYKGWPEYAPFDAIIVTCAPNDVPVPLEEQLAEGGRMIIPVGDRYTQNLVLLKKIDGKLERQNVLPVRFVPMIDESGNKY